MKIMTKYKEDINLINEIFKRTQDYIKTKEILIKHYGIKIWIEKE